VKRLLRGGALQPRERGELEIFMPEAAARSSVRERTADAAENELIERKKMTFMAEKVGEEFDGFICGVEAFGLFVELRDLFVEGLIAIEAIPGDRYRFIERRRIIQGERKGEVFALGDPVRVRLAGVNAARMEIVFALLEHRVGPRPAGPIAPVREIDTKAGRRGAARGKRREGERKRDEHRGKRRHEGGTSAPPAAGARAPAGGFRRGRRGAGGLGSGAVRSGRGRRGR
jgi:ribonuclease R